MASLLASHNNLGAAAAATVATPALHHRHQFLAAKPLPLSIPSAAGCRTTHVARARKGLSSSSRSRRLEKRGNKEGGGGNDGGPATTLKEEAEEDAGFTEFAPLAEDFTGGAIGEVGGMEYSTTPMPKLQGLEKNFWEGPNWDGFGFFVQYQWAFGIVFALIACGIAVATYNEGATDFRQTPIYKESIQSQELLEGPEGSDSDVFEANPTEIAPSLE